MWDPFQHNLDLGLFEPWPLVAKGIWEYEQHLWRSGNCPRSALDPAYWAHAAWHVGSAAAHHAAIVYHGDLQVAAASARSRAKVP